MLDKDKKLPLPIHLIQTFGSADSCDENAKKSIHTKLLNERIMYLPTTLLFLLFVLLRRTVVIHGVHKIANKHLKYYTIK